MKTQLLIPLFALLTGCATQRPGIPPNELRGRPLSTVVREELGAVAVVSTRATAPFDFRRPRTTMQATGDALKGGHAAGAMAGDATLDYFQGVGGYGAVGIPVLALSVAVSVDAAVTTLGVSDAIVNGVAPSRVRRVETTLARVSADVNLPEETRSRIAALIQSYADRTFRVIEDSSAQDFSEEAGSTTDVPPQIDTRLEIEIERVSVATLTMRHSPLLLVVPVNLRVVDARTGALLHSTSLEYRSGTRALEDWSVNGGEPFREELNRAVERLANNVVALVLGQAK